ncbi:hypothetical protein AB0F96_37080 [Streptomyces sp. NPDC023998]|uniref:hypothetical protein n=1 Tax=Streptomyces sp. NPDC023998 TaxID=3154597 RepID=UPI0033DF9EBB
MKSTEYRSLFINHLAGHLSERYGSSKWSVPLKMAVRVVQILAWQLERQEFDDFLECVGEAAKRQRRGKPQLLPDTFVSHLHTPLEERFGESCGEALPISASLMGVVHEMLPAEEFDLLLRCLVDTRLTMRDVERRLSRRPAAA